MYERLKEQMRFKRIGTQNLLAPISLELSKSETNAFERMLPEINDMGFEAEKFVDLPLMILGFFIAALSSYFTIVFFIKLLDKIGMMPFVVYRIILGVMLLAF